MALSGITLIVVCLYLIVSIETERQEHWYKHFVTHELDVKSAQMLSNITDELSIDTDTLSNQVKHLKSTLDTVNYSSKKLEKFKGDLDEYQKALISLEKKTKEHKQQLDSFSIDVIKGDLEHKHYYSQDRTWVFMKGLLWVFIIIGAFLSVQGFRLWYLKVQVHLDKQLNADKTESDAGSSLPA